MRAIKNNEINKITTFLKEKNLALSDKFDDGRINSIDNEPYIISLIKEYVESKDYIKLDVPLKRHWYDIAFTFNIEGNEIFVPVNIKITNFNNNSADNASSWKGLFWTFYNTIDTSNYQKMYEIIRNNSLESIKGINNDYYYIVVDKSNNNNIVFNSIKQMSEVTKNANNMPFQIKWATVKRVESHTFEESFKTIFTPVYKALKSFESRVEMGDYLEKIVNEA